jgi:SprT protein
MKTYSSEIHSKLTVSKDLQDRIETMVLDCLLKAQAVYGTDKVNKIPKILFTKKGRAAGTASWNYLTGEASININPILLNENVEYVVNQTVPHEVAHIVTFMIWGREATAHGYHWKSVMNLFGKRAERCHQLNTETAKQMRVRNVYSCKCQRCQKEFVVSAIIKGRMERGIPYTHRACGGGCLILLSYKPITQ